MRKKIVVVSDSHGNYTKLNKIIKNELPFDYLVHCGDGVYDLFQVHIPAEVKLWKVAGNVDLARGNEFERLITGEIHGFVFLVVHGDLYDIKNDFTRIIQEARYYGAHVVLFGHTHIAYKSHNESYLFNPGSVANGSYGIIELDKQAISFMHKKSD